VKTDVASGQREASDWNAAILPALHRDRGRIPARRIDPTNELSTHDTKKSIV
jgi:hypothetical protein